MSPPDFLLEAQQRPEGAGRTLSLHVPGRLWWVEAGYLDLFAVPSQGKGGASPPPLEGGSRRHLLRLRAREWAFGLPEDGSKEAVLAVLGPGCRLWEAPLAESAQLVQAVETWVEGMSEGLQAAALPLQCQRVRPGEVLELQPQEAAGAARQVTWLSAPAGGLALLGELDWPVGESIPVTRATWVQATGATKITACDSLTLFKEGRLVKALEAFHRLVLRRLASQREQAIHTDSARLLARSATDKRAMGSALAQMASIMGRAPTEAAIVSQDPLVAACTLVGEALGITVRPPAAGAGRRSQLAELAEASQFRTRQVLLRHGWWSRDSGPILAYLKTGRPVALLPSSPRTYQLVDPLEGTRQKVDAERAASLDPQAHTFYRPLPEGPVTPWKLLLFALQGCGYDLGIIALMGFAGGLLGLFTPIVTGTLVNLLIPAAARSQVWLLGIGFLLVTLATGMFEFTRAVSVQRIEGKMEGAVQPALWDRILTLPASFFRRFSAGDLASRAMGIQSIRQMLTDASVTTLLGAIFSLLNLALMFYYSVALALLATGLLLALVLAMTVFSLLQVNLERPMLNLQGDLSGMILQLLQGIAKIRVAGAEARAFARWGRDFAQQKQLSWRSVGYANTAITIDSTFTTLAAMVLFLGVSRANSPGMPAGDFLAFYAAFGQLSGALLSVTSTLTTALYVVPTLERTRPILLASPEVSSARPSPGLLRGEVELSHLTFRYRKWGSAAPLRDSGGCKGGSGGPAVLDDVSLRVGPGEFVAIVGPSGSGKSTLFRLLLGFETPDSGSIYFDGQDLQDVDLRSVRRQMGVVLQDSKLMPGDIMANIVGSSGHDLEDAWEAARMAGLEADIEEMPMGMRTVIMEGAGTFSGGQRQRLMIARAIVNRPRILLFDEATSALDSSTQEAVTRSLESLRATRIVIAHRLSTIRNADRIYVVEGGQVVQTGSYQELMQAGGTFERLVRRQLS